MIEPSKAEADLYAATVQRVSELGLPFSSIRVWGPSAVFNGYKWVVDVDEAQALITALREGAPGLLTPSLAGKPHISFIPL